MQKGFKLHFRFHDSTINYGEKSLDKMRCKSQQINYDQMKNTYAIGLLKWNY